MAKIITKLQKPHNFESDERGIAILLSLLILFLLVTLILDFDYETRADLRAAGNFRDDQKAYLLAQSAVNAARAVLRDDAIHSPAYDANTEFWATPLPAYTVGDGTLTGAITDETGKFNLNVLANPRTGGLDQKRYLILRRLFENLDLDPDKVDAIVDWIDNGDEPMPRGAENDYYQSLNPPYSCKNAPMETISELHRIKGFDDETFKKVAPFLTVYGDDKINANTADPLLIEALDERIDQPLAERVVANRPWENAQKLKDLLGATYVDVLPYIKVSSNVFLIQAEGKVNDTIKRITAVVQRNGTSLPFLYYRVE